MKGFVEKIRSLLLN